jgi:flagellar protein FlaG
LEKNRANSKDHTETCEAVEAANKTLTMNSYHLKFRIDKESERIQVKLYDDETNKLIKEIPPDVMLELSARIKRIIETHRKWIGVLVDEVA